MHGTEIGWKGRTLIAAAVISVTLVFLIIVHRCVLFGS
jgi:hypothetical protein